MKISYRSVSKLLGCLVLAHTVHAGELWEPYQYCVPYDPDPCVFLDDYSNYSEPVLAGDRMAVGVSRDDWKAKTFEYGILVFQRDAEDAWEQLDYIEIPEYLGWVDYDFSGEYLIYRNHYGVTDDTNVHVYKLSGDGTYEETFQITNPVSGDSAFGRTIAISGSLIGIGDEYWPDHENKGAVWIYRLNADETWSFDSSFTGATAGDRIGEEFALHEDVFCFVTSKESSEIDVGGAFLRTGVGAWSYVSGFTETDLGVDSFDYCERRGDILEIVGGDYDSSNSEVHVAVIQPGVGIGALHHLVPQEPGFVYHYHIGAHGSEVIARRDEPWDPPLVGGSVYDIWTIDPVAPPVLTGEITLVFTPSYGHYTYTGDSLIMDVGFVKVDDGEGSYCAAHVLGEIGYLPPAPCPEDLSGDGVVGVDDLLMIIAAWGSCP